MMKVMTSNARDDLERIRGCPECTAYIGGVPNDSSRIRFLAADNCYGACQAFFCSSHV